MKRQHSTLLLSASYPRLSISCLHQQMGAHGSGFRGPGKRGLDLQSCQLPGARRQATLIKRLPGCPSQFPCELGEGTVPSKVVKGKKTRRQKCHLYKGKKQPQRAPHTVSGVFCRPKHFSWCSTQPEIYHLRLGTGTHSEDDQEPRG